MTLESEVDSPRQDVFMNLWATESRNARGMQGIQAEEWLKMTSEATS